jgi:hypothetical protein
MVKVIITDAGDAKNGLIDRFFERLDKKDPDVVITPGYINFKKMSCITDEYMTFDWLKKFRTFLVVKTRRSHFVTDLYTNGTMIAFEIGAKIDHKNPLPPPDPEVVKAYYRVFKIPEVSEDMKSHELKDFERGRAYPTAELV